MQDKKGNSKFNFTSLDELNNSNKELINETKVVESTKEITNSKLDNTLYNDNFKNRIYISF